jgi:hypothetical protein
MSESEAPPRNDVRASRTAEPLRRSVSANSGSLRFITPSASGAPGSQLGGGVPYELGRLTGERAVGDRYPRDRGPDGTHVLSGCTRRRWLARRRADWLIGPPDHSTSRQRSLTASARGTGSRVGHAGPQRALMTWAGVGGQALARRAGVQDVELSELLDDRLLDRALEVKSNSSRVLRAGNLAKRS